MKYFYYVKDAPTIPAIAIFKVSHHEATKEHFNYIIDEVVVQTGHKWNATYKIAIMTDIEMGVRLFSSLKEAYARMFEIIFNNFKKG